MKGPHNNIITKRKARNKPCVFPDQGGDRPNDFPCFPDDDDSMCCAKGDACMSNRLCRAPGDQSQTRIRYTRGSCTDDTWQSSACPKICANANPSGSVYIAQCFNDPDDQFDSYDHCCDDDFLSANWSGCCAKLPSYLLFELDYATTLTTVPWVPETYTSTPPATTSSSTSTTTSSTSSSLSTTKSSSQSGTSGAGGGGGVGGESSSTGGISAPTPTSAPVSDGNTSNNNSNTLTIGLGAGLGGGLFAVVLILAGFWLMVRRRRAASAQAVGATTVENLGGGIYESWESQPFVVDNKSTGTPPPPFGSLEPTGGWQQPFAVPSAAELGSPR